MLKTFLRIASTRRVLCHHLQSKQNANQSLPSVYLRFLSILESRNCAKVATDEDNEIDAKPLKNNPFSQSKPVQPLDAITTDALNVSDEDRAKLLKVLKLEVDIAYQEGKRVPLLENISEETWAHILTLSSRSARFRYYSYLWQVERKKEAHERKKQERAVITLVNKEKLRKEREENKHIIYGLGHTSLFLRIYDSTINNALNHRLVRAMQFSPKIVLDCSYDQHMTRREAQNAAKQLMLCFADNRAHDDPFDLHYCNVNLESIASKALKRYIPTMLNPEFPMNIHEQCFTELFDKKSLVYLTPHCRKDLESYNPDDIYIIGAMVDTVNNEPLSLAKAKRLGLRMARLPLDRYLQWGSGSGKSLTLNQMIAILLDLKTTKDWAQALRHVPRRKIIDMSIEEGRQRRALEKRGSKLNFNLNNILDENEKSDKREYRKPKIRAQKDAQFNLNTWGTKKNRNTN